MKINKYKFTLEENYIYKYSRIGRDKDFYDQKGNLWMSFRKDGSLIIYKNYSWDGCSPKIKINNKWIGTWDGKIDPITSKPQCYYASLVHDALCQFWHEGMDSYSLSWADEKFLDLMKQSNFKFANLYYDMVRLYHVVRYGK